MLIDITMRVTPEMLEEAKRLQKKELEGHLGTHFDAMDKEFPLDYTVRRGTVFDVRGVSDGEIGISDVDLERVEKDSFIAFCTGYSTCVPYGSRTYFSEHPQLSVELIDALAARGVSIIGVDCGGVRRGKEHIPVDQRLADRGIFVVENLIDLEVLLEKGDTFVAHTYPMRFTGVTGLPCRVLAEI